MQMNPCQSRRTITLSAGSLFARRAAVWGGGMGGGQPVASNQPRGGVVAHPHTCQDRRGVSRQEGGEEHDLRDCGTLY